MLPLQAKDYLEKIPEDEPVFVLRAQDAYAPAAIIAWSALVGAPLNGKPASDESIIKSVTARQLAEEMRRWQEKHYLKTKIPD